MTRKEFFNRTVIGVLAAVGFSKIAKAEEVKVDFDLDAYQIRHPYLGYSYLPKFKETKKLGGVGIEWSSIQDIPELTPAQVLKIYKTHRVFIFKGSPPRVGFPINGPIK